ncbi:bifunctional diaminohydroxyphosphoribosylaminopyrimidine deaminase/5-amino-6-(5-phosphoribosylamino)uracil reductase RibD [Aureivirga sp. CE67]|uniref:bifunctional diaminohydroxyphosphoribosylaminopyrimidine deaminase/5-amino-6-(5-phosphoribosylamino)uracil reductase RibD n=1 Tax=Aureivirga sp. CE67 TaxID=1788983 RepID=UPI0018CB7373|nr:bifunctional diaminohydroxyphosphoribosylaminopyrimidine deaminase/5-amino-6-(5-phosphoribosylamino)uracil reductase RibD [Aureivirga sp. CE67]
MKNQEKYIRRCIELAKNGLGKTYPNPMVGSVIVHNGRIIGEGWHKKAGQPHAEVNAVNSVKEEYRHLLKDSTIFVSLEPCSHFGKTPPCANLIVNHGIKKVVIGIIDSNSLVSGRGVSILEENGHEVEFGSLQEECYDLNKRFFTFQNKKRPYIILKWAASEDGFLDQNREVNSKEEAKPNWITNAYSRQLVHKWRTEEQAILVGTTTVLKDNPSLTSRDWKGNNPVRVVLDRSLKIPQDYQVYNREVKTIILTEKEKESDEILCFEKIDFDQPIAKQICDILYKHNLQSLIVEGGKRTLETFAKENLWDETRIFHGEVQFFDGVKEIEIKGKLMEERMIDEDNLKIYYNK